MTDQRDTSSSSQRYTGFPGTFVRVLKQLVGVAFILSVAGLAFIATLLPIPSAYVFLLGYGAGIALFLPGALLATAGRPFGKSLLGGGAACIFLTTVAAFFADPQRMLPFPLPLQPYSGLLLCLGLLALFAVLAWRAASQSNSLLTVALAIYLLHLAAPGFPVWFAALTVFFGVILLAAWLWVWTARRPYWLFPQCALFLGYGAVYFLGREAVAVGGLAFAYVTAGLVLFYGAMTQLVVRQTLREPVHSRPLVVFAAINTLLFVSAGVALLLPDSAGWLWLVAGVVFVTCTVATVVLYVVQGDSVLVSFFSATGVIALLAGLLMPLATYLRLIVLAAGCAAPALMSGWRNDRLLRLTEYGLLSAVFVGSFSLTARADYVLVGPVGVPVYWAWLLAAAGMLCLVARLHTCWIYAGRGERVQQPGGVSDPRYRPDQELLAFACAFVAALIVALHTVLTRGDGEMLPFILAAQGMVFLGLGLLFFTPALALAGLAPVIGGHAIYYAFPYLAAPAVTVLPETQLLQVCTLAAATVVLAVYADRLLLLRLGPTTRVGEKLMACIPYLPALALLLVMVDPLPVHYLPLLLGVLSALCLLPSWRRRPTLPGMTALGIACAVLSVPGFFLVARMDITPAYLHSGYVPLLALYVLALLLLERLTAQGDGGAGWSGILLARVLIALAVVVGAVGLHRWNSGPAYVPALLGFAVLLSLFGGLFRTKAHYYAAAALVLFALGFALLAGGSTMVAALLQAAWQPGA